MTSPPPRRSILAASTVLAALLALAGCAASPAGRAVSSGSAGGVSGELRVYAAASLAGAFDRIAEEFERENPGVDILPLVYDGSSTLATQLLEGAQADVFASADERSMAQVDEDGLTAAAPRLFATNTLTIVVPRGNSGGVAALGDLADPALAVVLCAVAVPCGAASQRLLQAASVDVTAASYEQSVAAVLTKVAADEADAGLVYATDAAAHPEVEAIVPEGATDVVNRYPIAPLKGAANPDAAAAFVAHVTGSQGQATLADLGFGAP